MRKWGGILAGAVLWATTAAAQLVPFLSDPSYQRNEPTNPPWFVENNGQPSILYHNGVYQSQEVGNDDLDLFTAWGIQASGSRVGIMDMTVHGARTVDLVATVSPLSERRYIELVRWLPGDLADGIRCLIGEGCRVIIVGTGFSTEDPALLDACALAAAHEVILCCAVPNTEVNLDSGAYDYPYSWSLVFGNIIGVNCTSRTGEHYAPSATGTHVLGAPGRNIVAAGTYSSGTSWAVAIFASCVSLLTERYSGQDAAAYRAVLEGSALGAARRVDIVTALRIPDPRLVIAPGVLTVCGLPDWKYAVERSDDLVTWSRLVVVKGGDSIPVTPGFFRASANVGWEARAALTKHKKRATVE